MFSVQMPVYSVDNSIESDFSEIGKPVESENYQDKGKFKNIFDSISSDYKEKTYVKKSIDKTIKEQAADRHSSVSSLNSEKVKKELKSTDKNLIHKNAKLISLKKGKAAKSVIEGKKVRKKNHSFKDSQIPILPGKNIGIKNLSSESDKKDQDIDLPSTLETESVDKSKVAFATNVLDLKSSLFQIRDSAESKVSLKKSSIEKKTAGIKKTDSSKIKKSKLSILDLRENRVGSNKLIKKAEASELTSQKNQSDIADPLNSENQDSAKPIVIEITQLKDNFSGESKTLTSSSGSALMKQLEESINGKIVKQSSLVLKDSGAGEIKLILKPEQLGKVRIKLNMQDNRISGHIIVDNASVKDIFENNLQNLERAFREQGFDTAALNVSVGGEQSGNRGREKANKITKQIELIDESIPTVYRELDNLIDLVV